MINTSQFWKILILWLVLWSRVTYIKILTVNVPLTITTHVIRSKVKKKYCVIYGEIFIVFKNLELLNSILKSQYL